MAFKFIFCSILVGVILANHSFSIPVAALPSFGFIFVVYGALILWELRKLIPSAGHAMARYSEQPDGRLPAPLPLARPSQTRSSTA